MRDAAVEWMVNKGWRAPWHAPVVAETYDGLLNDINGYHVTKQHAFAALDHASSGPVQEGAVGGGTGMICNRFKGGNGTASRKIELKGQTYMVGVFVQCNYGGRTELRQIAGVPVDALHKGWDPCYANAGWRPENALFPVCTKEHASLDVDKGPDGSIIIVVATDAPLLPNQLKRLAKRPSLGLGWLGAVSAPGSGDIFIAFSTAFDGALREDSTSTGLAMFPNNELRLLFNAVEEATEESIVNAMVAAKTMVGANGVTIYGLPTEELRQIMKKR
jgi:L-aminopeptidase/D-esterase-like protein